MDTSVYNNDDSLIEEIKLDLPSIKTEICRVQSECCRRGLLQTSKWLAEISYSIRTVTSGYVETQSELPSGSDLDTYNLAKSYFDLKEYDRAAYFTKDMTSPLCLFLHLYSRYMSAEKKRLDDLVDTVTSPETSQLSQLKQLRREMEQLQMSQKLDGYGLYVYGVVLRKLSLPDQAIPVLCDSIRLAPAHWGAWLELSCLVTSRDKLAGLDLPDHWCKQVFLAHTYLELQQNEQAVRIYEGLSNAGLRESTYIMAQVAIAYHNMRQVDEAVTYFKQLAELDPFRLDNLDTYSNLLYVKEQRVELAHLAHKTNLIDKYRTETCCVIGNYYSLRSQHEKAVVYFQRALKLNPGYLSALTLMGHEYMEMKNTKAAIQSYRQAIEANRRDYRAWYGLGQTYEILKMHHYCLYYFKQAQELRPSDSRMLVALGESYEKLDKIQDAKKCFWKAYCVGDIEGGIALQRLAKLFEASNEPDQAAEAYVRYIQDTEEQGISDRDRDDQIGAFRYLAKYYNKKDMLNEAYEYAMKCKEFSDSREEDKALLREISSKRGSGVIDTGNSSVMEHTGTHSVLASRMRPNIVVSSPGPSPRRDLEPVNLNFTP